MPETKYTLRHRPAPFGPEWQRYANTNEWDYIVDEDIVLSLMPVASLIAKPGTVSGTWALDWVGHDVVSCGTLPELHAQYTAWLLTGNVPPLITDY